MAKKTTESEEVSEDLKKGVTQTYSDEDEQDGGTERQTPEEYSLAKTIYDRAQEMRQGMQTSCPFPNPDSEVIDEASGEPQTQTTSTIRGGSIYKYLDRCDIQWIMLRQDYSDSTNLKSPLVFAPIEAAMADFQGGQVLALLEPTQDQDTEKVKLINAAHDYLYYKARLKRVDKQTFHDTLKYGFSIRYVGYFLRKETKEISKKPREIEKEMEDDKKKKEIEKLQKEGKTLSKKVTTVVYDDIGHVRVDPREFLIDNNCTIFRDIVTGFGEAEDCGWIQTPTKEACFAEFKNSDDPYVKNVDKIVSAKEANQLFEGDKPFFKVPNNIIDDKQVELLRYYNKRTNKYIVLCNDIVIRDGPLPYDHGELPFVVHNLIEWEGRPFGIGICGIMEGLQSEDEILRSLTIQQLKLSIAPPLMYNKEYEEDLDAWQTYEAGQKVGIAGPVSSDNVTWMPSPSTTFNYYPMSQEISRQGTMISGIDPLASSQPRPNEAVRTHMLSMEATQKIIEKHVDNWGDARAEAVWMDIKLMHQFYPFSKRKQFTENGEEDGETYGRVIKTQGFKYTTESKGNSFKVKEEKVKGNGFFNLEEDHLSLAGDIDIKLNLDQVLKPTKSALMNRAIQAFPLFMQAFNPQVRDVPGMSELTRWLGDVLQVPERTMNSIQDTSSQESKEEAIKENKILLAGYPLPGTPGSSEGHLVEHYNLTFQLAAEIAELQEGLAAPVQQVPPTPEGVRIVEAAMKQSRQLEEEIQGKQKALDVLTRHIQTDRTPKGAAMNALQSQQPQPAMQPQGMGNPMMGGMGPEMGGMMPPGGSMMGAAPNMQM